MSRAEEKRGPLTSQPGKVSSFLLILKPSNTLWKGYISDSKGACAPPPLEGPGARQMISTPLSRSPQKRRGFSSELQLFHLHQASNLSPEAAGTRRGQTSRPLPYQAPPAGASQTSPTPSRNCQQGFPAHTCQGGLHSPGPALHHPTAPEQGSTAWHTGPMWDGGSRK